MIHDQDMTIQVGDTVILDKEFNNSSEVVVLWLGKLYATVKAPGDSDKNSWEVMRYRLTAKPKFMQRELAIKHLAAMIARRTDFSNQGEDDTAPSIHVLSNDEFTLEPQPQQVEHYEQGDFQSLELAINMLVNYSYKDEYQNFLECFSENSDEEQYRAHIFWHIHHLAKVLGIDTFLFEKADELISILEEYPIQDDIWPSRRWNRDRTSYTDLSGHHFNDTDDDSDADSVAKSQQDDQYYADNLNF